MLAEEVDFVIGVDTHRDEHMLAVVAADTGAIVAEGSVSADARGYRQALAIVEDRAPGRRVWAIEGTGSYLVDPSRSVKTKVTVPEGCSIARGSSVSRG
jgi:transposase